MAPASEALRRSLTQVERARVWSRGHGSYRRVAGRSLGRAIRVPDKDVLSAEFEKRDLP